LIKLALTVVLRDRKFRRIFSGMFRDS